MAAEPLSSWVQKSPVREKPKKGSILNPALTVLLKNNPVSHILCLTSSPSEDFSELGDQYVRAAAGHINTCNIVLFMGTQCSPSACGWITSHPVYW